MVKKNINTLNKPQDPAGTDLGEVLGQILLFFFLIYLFKLEANYFTIL